MFEVDDDIAALERVLADLAGSPGRPVLWVFADEMCFTFSRVFANRDEMARNRSTMVRFLREISGEGVGVVLDAFGETGTGELIASAMPAWTADQGERLFVRGVRFAVANRPTRVVPVSKGIFRLIRRLGVHRPDWGIYPVRDSREWRLAPDRIE